MSGSNPTGHYPNPFPKVNLIQNKHKNKKKNTHPLFSKEIRNNEGWGC